MTWKWWLQGIVFQGTGGKLRSLKRKIKPVQKNREKQSFDDWAAEYFLRMFELRGTCVCMHELWEGVWEKGPAKVEPKSVVISLERKTVILE